MSETNDTAQAADATTAAASSGPETVPGGWRDSLPADLRDSKTLGRYDSAEEAMRGHLKLEQLMGKDRLPVPDKDNPAEWSGWEHLGYVPRDQMDTAITMPEAPDGVAWNDAHAKAYLDFAAENKVPAWMAQKHLDHMMAANVEAHEAAKARAAEMEAKLTQTMREEWGASHDEKLADVRRVLTAHGLDEGNLDTLGRAFGDDAKALKFVAAVAPMLKEGSLFQSGGSGGMTPESAKAEIQSINDQIGKLIASGEAIPDDLTRRQTALFEVAYREGES